MSELQYPKTRYQCDSAQCYATGKLACHMSDFLIKTPNKLSWIKKPPTMQTE